ncbi:hypothetical protein Q5752_003527 [Cryptotrichosporon argae]
MAEPSTVPHQMRISTSGKLESYVSFAVDFLCTNPRRPLVLHTRPTANPPASRAALHPSTTAAARLVSVVELVKRAYVGRVKRGEVARPAEGRGKGKGKGKAGEAVDADEAVGERRQGIWQYTESGLVGPVEGETMDLTRVLSGKSKPKMTHRPYLQITLSTRPLGLHAQRNVSCQCTVVRRRKAGARGARDGAGATAISSGAAGGEEVDDRTDKVDEVDEVEEVEEVEEIEEIEDMEADDLGGTGNGARTGDSNGDGTGVEDASSEAAAGRAAKRKSSAQDLVAKKRKTAVAAV